MTRRDLPAIVVGRMSEHETISRLLSWTARGPENQDSKEQRVSELLRRICPNLHGLEVLKVAGTNGKGSVAAALEACLKAGGKRVGLFTSPHLERVTERIRINSLEINPSTLEAYASRLEPLLLDFASERGPDFVPYFFEVMLLIAVQVFLDEKVDYAVFEAGIGGGRDATAMLPSQISVITTVSYDHEDRLGASLLQIAAEKAGIAAENSTLILGPRIKEDVKITIRRATSERNVRIIQAPLDRFAVKRQAHDACVVTVSLPSGDMKIDLPLLAGFQLDNLSTVLAVLETLARTHELPVEASIQGVAGVRCPGRFEYIDAHPSWLLDGAHNREAISALISGIRTYFASSDRVLIYGTSRGKSYAAYLARLAQIAQQVYVTDDFHNAQNRETLAAELPKNLDIRVWNTSVEELVRSLQSGPATRDKLVVTTGSLFLVGRVRSALGIG